MPMQTTPRLRLTIGLTLLLLFSLFVIQNAAVVEIDFLFWSFALSRSLMIIIVLMVGIIIGWLAHSHWGQNPSPAEPPHS